MFSSHKIFKHSYQTDTKYNQDENGEQRCWCDVNLNMETCRNHNVAHGK